MKLTPKDTFLASALIFAAALALGASASASIGLLSFLSAWFILEFYSEHSQEQAFRKRMEIIERNLAELREIQRQMALGQGLRNARLGVTEDPPIKRGERV